MRETSREWDKKLTVNNNQKTALAEAFAGEMNWPLLELSMAKVMDSLVGESEKRIAYALEVAKASAPCVLLLDEVNVVAWFFYVIYDLNRS